MKKHLLLASTLAFALISAQNNEGLKREFEKLNRENNAKFDSYVIKTFGKERNAETQKRIDEMRENLAGFSGDVPNFYETDDQNQIFNNNVDALTTAGGVNGLTAAFNGEGIKYTIFDGGRIYAPHTAFDNAPNRIINMESDTNSYSSHATGVASIIGSKSVPLNQRDENNNIIATGNTKGIALNSTMESYRFSNTVLPGGTAASTVFDKILIAQPKISNHSYGVNPGWTYNTTASGYPYTGWYWNGNYISGNNYNLMGTYYQNDQAYDAIVYNNPAYTIVKSAGNYFGYGPGYSNSTTNSYYNTGSGFAAYPAGAAPEANCAQGFDCVGYGSLAKNIIVVGATDIITSNNYRYNSPTDVVRSDYSNAGPRDDGGIKPDIAAPGTGIWMASTAENTTGSVTWQVNSGTSMAAPQVAGIIGLWMQIHKSLFNNAELNAAASKTLMVHSAAEAGNVGPDPWYGWGYIDAKKGAELLVGKSNNSVIFNNETLTSGVANQKTVTALGNQPLKVTISWIDPEYKVTSNLWSNLYNNRVSRLVNDLDLRIIDTTNNTVYQPWKLDATSPMTPATKGDNTVDNVEQVVIDNPVAGRTYRIEITNKGTLVNNAATPVLTAQNYSIVVTGQTQSNLGTSETNALNGLAVAPSITKDIVNILKAPKKSAFTIYDLSGKKLQNGIINSERETIDLSSYAKGIYIIEIKTNKEVISKKVIKE
ncbi:S8 family peptidase [Chryseobacterium indologenes]|uniref:Secretion protein Por n=1 Tax=Chryseobacterium indologenes TaxID=253 RepID=A0A0N0IXF5_CHRID|nr:S8 family peptidase [Chryseobacterium indologenes]KPE52182.1 secretion protein Por [Chryseobacterium indologenes]